MRHGVGIPVLALAATSLALGSPPGREVSSSARQPDPAERAVRALEDQWSRAVLRGDRAFFERVLADDFTQTSHSGRFLGKGEWLAESKFGSPRPGATHYDAFDVDDLAVRLYGDTAVVTGRSAPRGRNIRGEPIRGRYRFLRVWVKRQGRWQVVAFQGTRIAES